MTYTECKHYKCKDKTVLPLQDISTSIISTVECCEWKNGKCINCRNNKEIKIQAEQWIKILEIVNNATSELGNKLAKTLYTQFYLDEVFEDFSLLQDLEVDIPTDFIHLDMDMRGRSK
jgi:hypothetical protein